MAAPSQKAKAPMSALTNDKLVSSNFDPQEFLKAELASVGSGGNELKSLRQLRSHVQKLADDSAQSVKHNVFVNFQQFIDTANEISYLEREMYELSHHLKEQQTLIEQLQDLSVSSQIAPMRSNAVADHSKLVHSSLSGGSLRASQRKTIKTIADKVEGLSMVSSTDDRFVLFEGELVELDTEHLSMLRTIYVYLLTDCLLITVPNNNVHRSSMSEHKLDTQLALENIAIANVSDREETKNAFKLLIFPSHKCFACATPALKREWLNAIETAKSEMLRASSLFRQNTIRSKRRPVIKGAVPSETAAASSNPFEQAAGKNPFDEPESRMQALEDGDPELEWLRELPDELDVCIAQRDFDTAVDLLFEGYCHFIAGRENLGSFADGPVARDIKDKLSQKEASLVDSFARELKQTGDGGPQQRGPKTARKAVTLLIRLNKAALACDLYLKNRTSVVKQQVKHLKIAEDPLSYLRNLTRIIFGNLSAVTQDFAKLFALEPACFSVLIVWASGEVHQFVSLVLRHIFDPAPSLSVIGHTVRSVFASCAELTSLGLDLRFELESLMTSSIEHALNEHTRNVLDAVKLRINDEKWQSNNLQTPAALYRYLEEMADLGLLLDQFVIGSDENDRISISVSSGSCAFGRVLLQLCRDLPLLAVNCNIRTQVENTLVDVLSTYMKHLNAAVLNADKLNVEQQRVVDCTATLHMQQVIPLCEQLYNEEQSDERFCLNLMLLVQDEFPEMAPFVKQEEMMEDIGSV